MVFQSYALYPHLTVRDNLAFGLRLRGVDEAAIAARVDEVAKMLAITHAARSPPQGDVGRAAAARGHGPGHRATSPAVFVR
jgi:ABC-type sugar transport system ATPase subunit